MADISFTLLPGLGQERPNLGGPLAGSLLANRLAVVGPGCPLSGRFPASAGCGRSASAWPSFAHHGLCAPCFDPPRRSEGHVQAPSQRVLNAPASPYRCQQLFRSSMQIADEIAGLFRDTDLCFPTTHHLDHRAQPRPLLAGARTIQTVWVAVGPALPSFQASVALVQHGSIVMGHSLWSTMPACSFRPPSPCAWAGPNWLTGAWTWAMPQAEPTPATS